MNNLYYAIARFFLISLVALSSLNGNASEQRRLLFIGDSLTAGFIDDSTEFSPYPTLVGDILDIGSVEILATPGATAEYMLDSTQVFLSSNSNKYDDVIILLGTNDINYAEIMESSQLLSEGLDKIERLCQLLIAKKVTNRIVLLTIPDGESDSIRQLRGTMNAGIKKLGNKVPQIKVFDLEAVTTFTENKNLFSDGIHFTADGYQFVAQHIAKFLERIL